MPDPSLCVLPDHQGAGAGRLEYMGRRCWRKGMRLEQDVVLCKWCPSTSGAVGTQLTAQKYSTHGNSRVPMILAARNAQMRSTRTFGTSGWSILEEEWIARQSAEKYFGTILPLLLSSGHSHCHGQNTCLGSCFCSRSEFHLSTPFKVSLIEHSPFCVLGQPACLYIALLALLPCHDGEEAQCRRQTSILYHIFDL
jgi:hypothetical protein